MSLEDEVRELKRQVVELSRRTADIPVRWASGGPGSGGGGDSSTLGKQYLVVQPIAKATSCAVADWYTSGTGYLRDESTGLFDRSIEVPLVNSTFWPYVSGSLIKDLGGGFLVGLCSPAPGTWADDPEEP